MYVRCFYLLEILVEYLCHGRTSYVCAFLRKSAVCKIATCVLAICHVYIGYNIDNAAVGLFWEAFVFASVSSLHVEDRNMQTLRTYNT